tara:strand:+ start:2932 stop:3126 length:195 start_codon:yes stop_codon:yes gene_type:complete
MTQHYPSTIRMDIDIYRDRQAREKAADSAYMAWLRGEPEEDEDDLSDVERQLTHRDGRVYGGSE